MEHRFGADDLCPACGAPLGTGDRGCVECEKRQVFELPALRFEIVAPRAERRICPDCGRTVRAAFPEGVEAPVQSGTNLQAAALYTAAHQELRFPKN